MIKPERKTMLYKTGVEYGDYTINHICGCSHGCRYPCYAYMMAHRFGKAKTLEEWTKPVLIDESIDILKKELPKKYNKIKSVQLCFSTDPFIYHHDEFNKTTIEIIKLINSYNIPCYILTKGILPKELINLNKINYYGITLITLDDIFRKVIEPGAAPIKDRLAALEYLHNKGCNTWVSIEPYPTPNIINQNIESLLEKIRFVDRIIFGRLHYNKIVSQYSNYKEFYNDCVNTVVDFCEINKIDYHIKKGTITKTNN